ncbi:hypothetical protein CABS01_06066 [Colletotrichum abscissum]|uniref:uncharacterized protein n=1 Tax=Colletotrichum abscissum TaxID=1671311 RepID=UPI0027D52901|nr:uncharacterized protein CABS01_06066 [Colletotrichum abscissum]KAK1518532.1 hypothetical protein CABS01_06066 [Colletotrichum abscissum]
MNFWNGIFPKAMHQLRSTPPPKDRASTIFDIRNKHDWDTVYSTLDEARNKYQREGGPLGWLRKVRRKGADNITSVEGIVKIVSKATPNDPYATPILGALEVLLDAVKTAASVRKQVLEGFEGLVPIFSDVELFLGTFQGDLNIENASVDLTATTLGAIEYAIGFFISNEFSRGGKAFLKVGGYESDLRQSLESIKEKSKALMEEAAKSHIHEFHLYSRETRKFQEGLSQAMNSGFNKMEALMLEYAERQEERFQQQSREYEHVSDIDLIDMNFVTNKKNQFPPRQRVLAEQIVNTLFFRDWMVSPHSTKLLIQWDFRLPKTIAGVTPLSVFCSTVVQSLRCKEQFISALWFCGQHIDNSKAANRVARIAAE